jgi:nicotinamidase-related amidase
MTSVPVRDPVGDHLLTPQNSALVVIDYQPSQFAGVRSMDRDLLLDRIVSTVRTAKAFDMPIVHSTINVSTGRGQPTVPELAELLVDSPPIERTTTNAWEDAEFLAAVRATGRRKLILCADAHRAGIERVVQAGAQPVSWVALAVELQRDWAREETVADIIQIVLTDRLLKA